jgi:murein DD-endopeptidase MepM/ murein hydrolase activator NlpD
LTEKPSSHLKGIVRERRCQVFKLAKCDDFIKLILMRWQILILISVLQSAEGFEIHLSKRSVCIGETLEVIVNGAPPGTYTCWLNGKGYQLYRIAPNRLRTFIGFGIDFKARTCSISVREATYTVSGNRKSPKTRRERLAMALRTESPIQLWRGRFVWPVKGRITGRYGEKRIDGRGRFLGMHKGIDIRVKRGAPVVSSARGRVVFTGYLALEGETVVIDHGQGIVTIYSHLRRILAKMGSLVEKGEVIGRVGSTGRSTAPHLHFGLYVHGTPVNPLYYWLP